MAQAVEIRVAVLYSPAPREVHEWAVMLAAGSTVLQALQACPLVAEFPELDLHSAQTGIWGHRAPLDRLVRERDRIEIYRPLKVDPKLARRERFQKQGTRAAGLFARKENARRGY